MSNEVTFVSAESFEENKAGREYRSVFLDVAHDMGLTTIKGFVEVPAHRKDAFYRRLTREVKRRREYK